MDKEAERVWAEAEQLASKARSSGSSNAFVAFFRGGGRREEMLEDASEAYVHAGNLFKAQEQWRRAADSFIKAAELDETHQDRTMADEGARKRVQAASCLRKIDADAAIAEYERAIEVYTRAGRFSIAATYVKDIGEVLEQRQRWSEAAERFQDAARRYAAEDSPAIASGLRQRAAVALGWAGQYGPCSKLYLELADECASDALRRFNQRDYAFRALLCCLADGDTVAVQRRISEGVLEKGRDLDLVKALCEALDDADDAKFEAAVDLYAQVATIDDWKEHVLTAIHDGQLEGEGLA